MQIVTCNIHQFAWKSVIYADRKMRYLLLELQRCLKDNPSAGHVVLDIKGLAQIDVAACRLIGTFLRKSGRVLDTVTVQSSLNTDAAVTLQDELAAILPEVPIVWKTTESSNMLGVTCQV